MSVELVKASKRVCSLCQTIDPQSESDHVWPCQPGEAAHIHVGHNIPGYLPESDILCLGSVEDALYTLFGDIRDQQDFFLEGCEHIGKYDIPESQCGWCEVADECQKAMRAIVSGLAAQWFRDNREIVLLLLTPEGPDSLQWLTEADGGRESCETFAVQEN